MTASADLYKVNVTLPVKSGILADRPQFSLHFRHDTGAPVDADFTQLAADIMTFFNSTATGTAGPLCGKLSQAISTASGGVEMAFYEVPTTPGPMGSPVAVKTGTLSSVGATSLPEEVAVVMSFRANYGSAVEFGAGTRPRSRLRNRIYVGPLAQNVVDVDATTKRTKVESTVIGILMGAAVEKLSVLTLTHDWTWSVFSRAAWSDTFVAFVGCDDAFDTQRRRGPKALAKTETATL